MKKNIGFFMSLFLLFSFAYGATCPENSTEVGNECYCKEGFTRNNLKTDCIAVDTTARDTKLKEAIERMYNNGLTKYNTPADFKSDDYLTREQASKFFVNFYSNVLGKKITNNINSNIFSDINDANPDLKPFILQANNMGLFKGVKGTFLPKNKLTQAQAIAVAIRMINGEQEELKNSRYINYYNKAKKYGLLKRGNFDIVDLNKVNITRGDTALILYNLYNYVMNNKDNKKIIDYNNNLTSALNKCLDSEDENIGTFESGTEDEMNKAIDKILSACKESAKEIYNIGDWEGDVSLKNAVLTVISYNISFYTKAKGIVPYKRLENLTETQEIESNKIDKELKDLIEKFDKSYENLKSVQKEFSEIYNF